MPSALRWSLWREQLSRNQRIHMEITECLSSVLCDEEDLPCLVERKDKGEN